MPRRTPFALAVLALTALLTAPIRAAEADPFLWLEDVTGEKALAWVKEKNAVSTAELTGSDAFRAMDKRLLDILDSKERIPNADKMGPYYYNFWRDAKNTRGLWRRTTLDEYRKAEPKWEVIIDLDALSTAETENWVWHGSNCLEPEYKRCLISLSRGGADADVVREYDLPGRTFVTDGFTLPEAKNSISWRNIDSVFVGTDFGAGSLTTSGYPRIVKEWRRGTPLSAAVTVFEGKAEDVSSNGYSDTTPGFERDFVQRGPTFFTNETFVRRDGKWLKIDKPDDANVGVHRDLVLIELRTDWTAGGSTYPAGALLAADFEAFLKGERKLDILFQPTERTSLAGYSFTRHQLLVTELDNVHNRVYVLTHEKGKWRRQPLGDSPGFSTVNASGVDDRDSDDYWMTINDYLSPTALYLGSVGKGSPEKLKELPAFFDAKGLEVSQHEATSKDGTRIPYFQVARKGLALDGNNPTLLYGYGGFEVSMLPGYSGGVGAAWLEPGGVYVVANIRGGGEFGPRWHQAALKENRPRAYEDFIAVAEDLIKRKVTSTKHLGIQGGSNGGLLMGNMLTMRPDLFGAIVCQVPLLDMKRYNTLLAGASWMGEYGNPDLPEEWAFIQKFSPYQNMKKDVTYPRTLFTTSTRDDRVHPGHARKMAALMESMGKDFLYYENIEGGHGGAANNEQRAFMSALAYTFLWNQIR